MGMASKYLTSTEAANAVGITRATLHEWVKRGRVRASKQLGNRMRLWSESDLARLKAMKGTIKIGRPKKGKKK